MRPIQIIGAASGWGAQDRGCADGPDALRGAGLLSRLHDIGLIAAWTDTLRPGMTNDPMQTVSSMCTRLAQNVYETLIARHFPLVIGGDHSCAIGTWSGVHRAIGNIPFGLIWIDAHMDSHTPQTSPSGALHGMPLACLLGHGLPALTGIGSRPPQLLPQHVCLIGVRSFEPGEAALLEHLNVRIFKMDEIRRRGMDAIVHDALDIVQRETAGFGISIDLDALDPGEDPGVGSPVADGLGGSELLAGLGPLQQHPALLGLELMEYNPHRDQNQATANMALDLAQALLENHQLL